VLVSYAGLEEDIVMAMDMSGIRRIYTLVRLSYLGETFQVESVRSVPYQSVRVDLPVLAWT
jgi:nuclear pore complex protein Nup133